MSIKRDKKLSVINIGKKFEIRPNTAYKLSKGIEQKRQKK